MPHAKEVERYDAGEEWPEPIPLSKEVVAYMLNNLKNKAKHFEHLEESKAPVARPLSE